MDWLQRWTVGVLVVDCVFFCVVAVFCLLSPLTRSPSSGDQFVENARLRMRLKLAEMQRHNQLLLLQQKQEHQQPQQQQPGEEEQEMQQRQQHEGLLFQEEVDQEHQTVPLLHDKPESEFEPEDVSEDVSVAVAVAIDEDKVDEPQPPTGVVSGDSTELEATVFVKANNSCATVGGGGNINVQVRVRGGTRAGAGAGSGCVGSSSSPRPTADA